MRELTVEEMEIVAAGWSFSLEGSTLANALWNDGYDQLAMDVYTATNDGQGSFVWSNDGNNVNTVTGAIVGFGLGYVTGKTGGALAGALGAAYFSGSVSYYG